MLHEPGPINMSGFTSAKGFAVRAGEKLRLDSNYDGELLHTRVMGIIIVYMAPDDGAGARIGAPGRPTCATGAPSCRGRKRPPRFKVPIIGIKNGVAREIRAPRRRGGRGCRAARRSTVGDQFFATPQRLGRARAACCAGASAASELHNVTVANGPRGFSSTHLTGGRIYAKRLQTPGTYKLFCGLHPVSMTRDRQGQRSADSAKKETRTGA